jgi:hypothetical protein
MSEIKKFIPFLFFFFTDI